MTPYRIMATLPVGWTTPIFPVVAFCVGENAFVVCVCILPLFDAGFAVHQVELRCVEVLESGCSPYCIIPMR